ncbi:putative Holliday junction resolvase [Streptohalobacillus salinus]|uniref:Putative pre-16S rRNA nuclease n=1 Tax=Streptohalobacillus salinus TaxID=621096 RepID=A0A2V3WEM2_9BACI|nr:Holliday junction resolvase RuvX [Streptohalobacillus salinus]PXW91588.1 putative Holliday junction resolvase [Streptohalobacillus salinus]
MRKMGLDVGSKTIGVAMSDLMGWTAQGIETIRWNEAETQSADERLQALIDEYEVTEVIVGLPKHMNNDIGERGEKAILFAKHIEDSFGLKTVMWDERLSTMAAERVLLEGDVSRKKRKKVIDKLAAVMILQGYLDSQK